MDIAIISSILYRTSLIDGEVVLLMHARSYRLSRLVSMRSRASGDWTSKFTLVRMKAAKVTRSMARNKKRLPNAVAMPATNVTSRSNWREYGPMQPFVFSWSTRSGELMFLPQPGWYCTQHVSGTLFEENVNLYITRI